MPGQSLAAASTPPPRPTPRRQRTLPPPPASRAAGGTRGQTPSPAHTAHASGVLMMCVFCGRLDRPRLREIARDCAARPGARWMGRERGGGSDQCGRSVSRGASKRWPVSHPAYIYPGPCVLAHGVQDTRSVLLPSQSVTPLSPGRGVGRAWGRRVCGMSVGPRTICHERLALFKHRRLAQKKGA